MTRLYETAIADLEATEVELKEIEAMSEAEACYRYNVNCKAEIVQMLNEEIESLEREVEDLVPEVYEYEY